MKQVAATIALLFLVAGLPEAQRRGGGPPGAPGGPGRGARATAGTVERITVRGRDAVVYLPPSYAGDQNRRFPTLYLLHGSGQRENAFIEVQARLQESADRLAGAQGFSEFIVVTPNASVDGGAMYPAEWDRLVAEELVADIDSRYRTLAHRMSRGLAGHDTGGAAALRIGMKRPQVFADLYLMSASPDAAATRELDANVSNLNAYYAFAIDVGSADPNVESNRQLHAALTKLRVAHLYEEYDGDRANRLGERIERNMLPFFARGLASPANLTSPSPGADRLAAPSK